ncbi:hypothetical protein KI387_043161, partial [Taxus chinensis]
MEQMIYARICILMDLNIPLPTKISIVIEEDKWGQVLNYENIPIRCLCHEYGHLVRDCKHKVSKQQREEKTKDDFITLKKKQTTKKNGKEQTKTSNNNRFASLQANEEKELDVLMESQVPETQMDKQQAAQVQSNVGGQNQMAIFQAQPNKTVPV